MPFSKLADGIATWRAFRTCCEKGFFDCASTLCFTERGRSSLKELKGRKSQASVISPPDPQALHGCSSRRPDLDLAHFPRLYFPPSCHFFSADTTPSVNVFDPFCRTW